MLFRFTLTSLRHIIANDYFKYLKLFKAFFGNSFLVRPSDIPSLVAFILTVFQLQIAKDYIFINMVGSSFFLA